MLLLDKIIETIKKTGESPNVKGRVNPYQYYNGAFSAGSRDYDVKVAIKVVPDGNRYYYHALDGVTITSKDNETESLYGNSMQEHGLYQHQNDSVPDNSIPNNLQKSKGDISANTPASAAQQDDAPGLILGMPVDVALARKTVQAQTEEAIQRGLQERAEREAREAAEVQKTPAAVTQQTKIQMKQDQRDLVVKLADNLPDLQDISPVKTLTGKEFYGGDKSLIEKVTEFFDKIGNRVNREGFGIINLRRGGAKNSVMHGVGRVKAISFEAVPEVLTNGKQIDYQQNWKGRGYDSYVFAAPVSINGERVYVAAVVRADAEKNYYLHEVVDSNGNIITVNNDLPGVYKILDELKTNEEGDASHIKNGVTVQDGVTIGPASSSNNSIPNNQQKSKGAISANMPASVAQTQDASGFIDKVQ